MIVTQSQIPNLVFLVLIVMDICMVKIFVGSMFEVVFSIFKRGVGKKQMSILLQAFSYLT